MKTLLKILSIIFFAAATLFTSIYFVLLAINWNDQPPSKIAQEFATTFNNRAQVNEHDNAYVYLMGFSAAKTQNPKEWGMKRIAWSNTLINEIQEGFDGDPLEKGNNFRDQRSPGVRAFSDTCNNIGQKCLTALNTDVITLKEWITTEGWLYERYRSLLSHPSWLETTPFNVNVPLPEYADVFEGQKILLAHAWMFAGQGNVSGVRDLLNQDLRFWRNALASSDLLVSKMISVAALKRNFEWANIILKRLPIENIEQGAPPELYDPITLNELSMSRPLIGEWKYIDSMLKLIETDISGLIGATPGLEEKTVFSQIISKLSSPLYQPQDTSNQYAQLLKQVINTISVPLEQAPEALYDADKIQLESAAFPPSRFYNPIGDTLISIAIPAYVTYTKRVFDLEGARRALLLTITLRSQNIPSGQVQNHLHNTRFNNPYTGEPIHWDACDEAIVFTGLEEGERGQHSFLY